MEKEILALWIQKLNSEPDGKKRQAIVSEMREAHGLKTGDALKLLKEAGYGVKPEAEKWAGGPPPSEGVDTPEGGAGKDAGQTEGADAEAPPPAEEKISVTLRHKTEYPRYRRAGLVLAQTAAPYEVTESQLAALGKDPWVVIEKEGGGK